MGSKMNRAFRVTDAPRPGVHDVLASTPLVTLAWRTLQAEHQHRGAEAQRQADQAKRLRAALAEIAEQAHGLRRSAGASQPEASALTAEATPSESLPVADRLLEILGQLGVTVLDSQGEPYTEAMMELWDNVVQRVDPDATAPWIAEVISPAVFCNNELLRMGKAVIAVPPGSQEASAEAEAS